MPSKNGEPFFPKDKPRSWVIGVSTGLLTVPLGVIAFLAGYLKWTVLFYLLRFLFVCCALVTAVMVAIFQVNSFSGRYNDFQSSSWKDRPW